MKIYIALPITGRDYASVVGDIHSYKDALESYGYEVLNPMTGKSYLRTEIEFRAHDYHSPASTNHAIFERDQWMIRNCDVALFDFWHATDKSIGMIMELAWASLLGKHTIAILPENNIHRHAFVFEAVDVCFDNPSDPFEYLHKLAKGTE